MSHIWEEARRKNPLVRRNHQVSCYGQDWRVANVIEGGGVRLRREILVHPADIKPTRPEIVCLCGSTRFSDAYQKANLDLTLAGKIVLTIGCDMKTDAALFADKSPEALERIKADLDQLHFTKIDLSDAILVLNVGGYIGDSTKREIAYARKQYKAVRFLELLPVEEF